MDRAGPSVIAVVDDDPSVLEAVGNLLESAGYAALPFNSAEELLNGGAVAAIDCVISDIGMPMMSGVALQTELGRLRPELPVILITGRNGLGNAGTDAPNNHGLFRKPFDSQQLLDALVAALMGRGAP
jgi:FixJ family two-component response regulator